MLAFTQPRLKILREATHELHQALHGHPVLKPLSEPGLTMEQYRRALQAFHAAYTLSEAARQVTLQGIPDAPVLAWLEQDRMQHAIAGFSVEATVCPIDTPDRLLGYLYVKQGSTLGGRVMSKNIERSLGLLPGLHNHFFAGYEAKTGMRWKQFLAGLEAAESPDTAAMATQAVASFQLIATCCDAVASAR